MKTTSIIYQPYNFVNIPNRTLIFVKMPNISLPKPILVDTVRCVGRENFLLLGSIMASELHGLAAVRTDDVLCEANITDFINNASLIRVGLSYRGFF